MDKNGIFKNLVIIKTLLQTLNETLQNTKISTIIYSNYSVVFFYHFYEFNHFLILGIRVF